MHDMHGRAVICCSGCKLTYSYLRVGRVMNVTNCNPSTIGGARGHF
jgi:hypothetical protein